MSLYGRARLWAHARSRSSGLGITANVSKLARLPLSAQRASHVRAERMACSPVRNVLLMPTFDPPYASMLVALGIGLLIGAERERRKGVGPGRAAAGIRTFAITSVLGAVSMRLGGELLLSVTTAGLMGLIGVAYYRSQSDDPGLTTEIALVLTLALGGLAERDAVTAAALAVMVAILLAARGPIHRFVREVLTETELKSALIFTAASLVVWPVIPDRYLGPFGAINPHAIWSIVILIMAISACGYVAIRALGTRYGLPVAGLASGFVSSSATIASMGARVAENPILLRPAVAGAVLSTLATVAQVAILVAATSPTTLSVLWRPLVPAGLAAVAYGAVFTLSAATSSSDRCRSRRSVQLQGSRIVCLHPNCHTHRCGCSQGLVWRNGIGGRCCLGRSRRCTFDGCFRCLAGGLRKDAGRRRFRTDPRWLHDEFDDQDHSCNDQRQ